MKFVRSIFPVAAAFGLLACGAPSPEKLCDHAMSLVQKEGGDQKMSDDQLETAKKMCVEKLKEEQKEDGEAYAKQAKCVMAAKNMEAMMKCDEKKPAKPDEDAEPAEQ